MKKTKLLKICQIKNKKIWHVPKDWEIRELVDQQEQYSRRNCLLVHGTTGAKSENLDDLVLKTVNEKLDINITENKIDRSHRIGRKMMGRDQDQLLLN